METIFTTELVQALGVGAIPIVIVAYAIYRLLNTVELMNKSFHKTAEEFNETMRHHINKNTEAINGMMKLLIEGREHNINEHKEIKIKQEIILKAIKIKK